MSPIEKGIQPNNFLDTKAIFGYKPLLYHSSMNSGNNANVFTMTICKSNNKGKMCFLFKAQF